MRTLPASLRRLVIARAADRCEYCQGLSQKGQAATFHIDHVVPLAAGGPTTAENLALACVSCSLRKAARRTAPDPETGEAIPRYHPRQQRWEEHFRWDGVRVVGLTGTGRATGEIPTRPGAAIPIFLGHCRRAHRGDRSAPLRPRRRPQKRSRWSTPVGQIGRR